MLQEAGNRAQETVPGAAAGGDPQMSMPSYQVGPMGMMGTPVETNAQGAVPILDKFLDNRPSKCSLHWDCKVCLMLKQQFSLLELTNK